jgi:hypothetical protein
VFLGHFGAALSAKPQARQASLGTLVLAAQFVDLLWPTLLLLGLESVRIAPGATAVTPLEFASYPISHSLLAVIGWAALLGILYRVRSGSARAAGIVAALVTSHWVLDFITHAPDLPLTPGGATRVGLGLWQSWWGTFAFESLLFAIGVTLYLRVTRARDRAGAIGLWGLIALLGVIHLANVLGPPPPSVGAIAWAGHAQWLLVAMGYWIDRHRVSVPVRRV